jgi:hypothetical protein
MSRARLFRSSSRRSLVWYLALSLLVVQGLKVHFHTFADHGPLHGHGHAIELHVGDVPTNSGHDDEAVGEAGFARYAVLKLKNAQADSLALVVVFTAFLLLGLALAGRAPWRPGRLFYPVPGGDVRIPPLRAPPL